MIRAVLDEDKAAIGKIYCESWKFAYKDMVPSEYLSSLTVENCTPRDILPHNNLLAEVDNEVIGTINFGIARNQSDFTLGEIRSIYLLPEYYGMGIGKELFLAASVRLKESGYLGFYLWVLKDNHRARAFYEKMGMMNSNIEKKINISGEVLSEVKYEYIYSGN